MDDWIRLDLPIPGFDDAGVLHGQVILIDRFGNLVTNVPGPMLPLLPRVRVGDEPTLELQSHYGEVGQGEPLAIIGSHGRLEIAVNGGVAARQLGAGIGEHVTIHSAQAELH